jgi:hypothetical protein
MKILNKILAITAIATCGFFFGGTGIASAQESASDSITVTAANEGTFTFVINDASYGFGTVNADGATTGDSTGVDGTTGSVFTKAAASTFTVTSSPVRTVHINNTSSVATIVWGEAASLEMQIPAIGGGSTCGYIAFDVIDGAAASCTLGTLIHAMSVGNDTAAVTGDIDLRLAVLNTDIVGSNSWTVNLTASSL